MQRSVRPRWVAALPYTALAVGALVCVLLIHLADFYAVNARGGIGLRRLAGFLAFSFAGALGVALLLWGLLRWWRVPFWRIALALAPVVYVFFSYHEFNAPFETYALSGELDRWQGVLSAKASHSRYVSWRFAWHMAAWGLSLAAIWCFAMASIRSPRVARVVLGVLLVMGVYPAVTAWRASESGELRGNESNGYSEVLRTRPNIYWLVADAYPGAQVLAADFGFDNEAFAGWLEERGFVMNRHTYASYPVSIYSVASTLEGRFLLDEASPPETVKDLHHFRQILRGDNRLVKHLRSAGYRYVHFSNGYDVLTQCGGLEDVCLEGTRQFDETASAFLSRTPVMDVLLFLSKAYPDRRRALAFGAFDELADFLPRVQDVQSPYFLYAHVVAPHPPMRFDAQCRYRPVNMDLQGWSADAKQAFLDQLMCINTQLQAVIGRIVRNDPDAVVVLQSDHGPAFRGQFSGKSDLAWDAAQVEERFAVLNAIKAPKACRASLEGMRSLVDTFSNILACLSHQEPSSTPPRRFIVPYDNSARFGTVVEVR